ncbi:MAG: tetratricopeptide repeat protein [Planctomycetes bacterium]|nr:tetratricopeptide repeat protein [Planctomycetota bacterium]
MNRSCFLIVLGAIALSVLATSAAQDRPPLDNSTPSTFARAQTLAAKGEYERVIEILNPVPQVQRDHPTASLLGRAYYETGKLTDARRCLQQALQLDPNDRDDHFLLGKVYLDQEKSALAVEHLQSAERLGLDTPDLHMRLATAHFRLGRFIGKIFVTQVAGGRPGRIVGDWYLIDYDAETPDGFLAARRGSAIYHLQRALDGGLDDIEIHLLHAELWLRAGHHARAVAAYRGIEKRIGPADTGRYHHGLARACLGLDDLDGFLKHLERAIAADPKTYAAELVTAYRTVADRRSAAGDLTGYIRYLRLAAREAPALAEVRYDLGNALHEAGHDLEASRQWRITLELQPDHPDRVRLLELIGAIAASDRGGR